MDDKDNYRLKNIESDVKEIINILNGKDGLITTIAIQEEKIKEIPSPSSLKWYATIGGGITSSIGIVIWLLCRATKGGL